MEQLIAGVLEKSLIGAAFLYLLWHNNITLVNSVKDIALTLTDVSNTLIKMDKRMEQVEQDVELLKRRGY